jgi:endonuclease G, mitochondrial
MRSVPLPVKVFAAAVSGIAVGVLGTLYVLEHERHKKPSLPTALQSFQHRFGLPSCEDPLLIYKDYAVKWDARTRNARYVLERLTKESVEGSATRNDVLFSEEHSLEPRFRNRLKQFKHSGYDRGHLAAAANHKADQAALDATFVLTNASPQAAAFNRGYWHMLERFIREIAVSGAFTETYVITGPLFLPKPRRGASSNFANNSGSSSSSSSSSNGNSSSSSSSSVAAVPPVAWAMDYPVIGQPPSMLHVPNFFFKVVIGCRADGTAAVAAFVVPHKAIPLTTHPQQFLVPLTALEGAAGLKFMPAVHAELSAVDRITLDEAAAVLASVYTSSDSSSSSSVSSHGLSVPLRLKNSNKSSCTSVSALPERRSSTKHSSDAGSSSSYVHLCHVVECTLKLKDIQNAVYAHSKQVKHRKPLSSSGSSSGSSCSASSAANQTSNDRESDNNSSSSELRIT